MILSRLEDGKYIIYRLVQYYEPGQPSWASYKPEIDPQSDLARLILGDPCQKLNIDSKKLFTLFSVGIPPPPIYWGLSKEEICLEELEEYICWKNWKKRFTLRYKKTD